MDKETDLETDSQQKKPVGIKILGAINLTIYGVLSLVFLLSVNRNPEQFIQFIAQASKEVNINFSEITPQQLKTASLIHVIFPLLYIISGVGLLRGKSWARNFTLYFAFTVVLLVFSGVLLHKGLISQAIFQIIYPGIIILYFTNKKVGKYFSPGNKEQ